MLEGETAGVELPFLRGTKGRILRLLRRSELTAEEIAAPLEVTPNGVRFHLAELERDGLVEQRSVRRGPRKPSHGYSLTQTGEALFPKHYSALLNAVLADTRVARGAAEMEALFRRLGHRLAAEHRRRFAGLSHQEAAAEALRLLEEIGGVATLAPLPRDASRDQSQDRSQSQDQGRSRDEAQPVGAVIVGASCPFKAVVPENPEVCCLLETVLADVLPGVSVKETCDKQRSRCRFELTSDTAS